MDAGRDSANKSVVLWQIISKKTLKVEKIKNKSELRTLF